MRKSRTMKRKLCRACSGKLETSKVAASFCFLNSLCNWIAEAFMYLSGVLSPFHSSISYSTYEVANCNYRASPPWPIKPNSIHTTKHRSYLYPETPQKTLVHFPNSYATILPKYLRSKLFTDGYPNRENHEMFSPQIVWVHMVTIVYFSMPCIWLSMHTEQSVVSIVIINRFVYLSMQMCFRWQIDSYLVSIHMAYPWTKWILHTCKVYPIINMPIAMATRYIYIILKLSLYVYIINHKHHHTVQITQCKLQCAPIYVDAHQ